MRVLSNGVLARTQVYVPSKEKPGNKVKTVVDGCAFTYTVPEGAKARDCLRVEVAACCLFKGATEVPHARTLPKATSTSDTPH